MAGPAFLSGEAVDLRTYEQEDVPFVAATVNDHRVWKSLGGQVTPTNLATERRFFEEDSRSDATIKFVVTTRDGAATGDRAAGRESDGETRVGMVELNDVEWDRARAEVAFWIAPDHQDASYGRDALATLVDYAFDQLGLHKLTAESFATNDASMRLLESLGFEREGTLREEEYVDGEWIDVAWYGLLAADWGGR